MSRISFLALLISVLMVTGERGFAAAGASGIPMLKLGLPARSTALADASVSWVSGASATWQNPAGVRSDSGLVELMLVHREWIQDSRLEFLGASFPIGERSALGFSLATQTVPDIEIRTRPGTPEGSFTARTLGVGLSYALGFGRDLRFGVTAKYLYEKILIDDASGLGFDVGAQWQSPLPDLAFGLALTNLGGMSVLRTESTTLPAMLRTGASWRTEFLPLSASALFSGDLLYVFPENAAYGGVGMELFFEQTVAVRAGYHLGSEGRGLTAGLGVLYGIVRVDYAYAAVSHDLGNAHSIGISLIL